MTKACSIVLLVLALAGCGGMPSAAPSKSSCVSPTSYECQVEMYMKAGA